MNDMYSPPAERSGLKTALVAGALVALVAASGYLYLRIDRQGDEIAKLRETLVTEIGNLREASSVTTASNKRYVEMLQNELEEARRQANSAASQAKQEALQRAELLARRLSEEQQRQQQQMASAISEVKEATTAANTKIGEVSGEVGVVKTEVASTKSELEKTISELKRAAGDIDQHGSLIATNARELAALRRLGERNFYEFKIAKSKQPQRLADITLLLKKADTKRHRFTLEVMADDKKTEKKDRNINEPLQFYVAKARQPYEIVVNEVKKDLIIGYLATPKDAVPRQ